MAGPETKPSYALSLLQRRRICWRMARGWSLQKAASAAGIELPDAGQLLQDGEFLDLVEAYRHLAEQPEEERHRRLLEMAWTVLETAIVDGDVRVCLFIFKEECRGRRPVETLARAVVKSLNGKPPPEPMTIFVPPKWQEKLIPAPKPKADPACPVDKAIAKGAAKARAGVLDEVEIEAAVERTEERAKPQRRCPPASRLTTMQALCLRIRTRNRTLAFGSARPTGNDPDDHPKQPNGP